MRESRAGAGPPRHAQSRSNLAIAYGAAGRLSEAIALHEATLRLREAKLGPDHLDTLSQPQQPGPRLLVCRPAAPRRSRCMRRRSGSREAKLGPDHLDTLVSRSNLANAYAAAGRLSEAIASIRRPLKLREAKLGPDHFTR